MTDAELIARLRDEQPVTQDFQHTLKCALMDAAADRIAALTAKIEELRAERDRRAEMHECAMSERDDATLYADEQKARAEAAEAEAAALRAKVARLEGALVDHNDLLRSALSIAKREGVDGEVASTNWDAYYNRVAVVLKRHHQIANEARAALTDGAADE